MVNKLVEMVAKGIDGGGKERSGTVQPEIKHSPQWWWWWLWNMKGCERIEITSSQARSVFASSRGGGGGDGSRGVVAVQVKQRTGNAARQNTKLSYDQEFISCTSAEVAV